MFRISDFGFRSSELPMKPTSSQVLDLFQKYVIGNYTRFPVCLVRGEGSYVWDAEGNRYLDLFPGWGCDLLGHCPPRVVAAVREQVGRLIHVPNTWYMEAQGRLAEALAERTGWGGRASSGNRGPGRKEGRARRRGSNGGRGGAKTA